MIPKESVAQDGMGQASREPESNGTMSGTNASQPSVTSMQHSRHTSPSISRDSSCASIDHTPANPISRLGTASLGLGRSASLKTPRTSIRQATDPRPATQNFLPLNLSKQPPTQLRPSSSSSQPRSRASLEIKSKTHHAGKSESHLPTFEGRTVPDSEAILLSAVSSPGLFTPVTSPLRGAFDRSDVSEPYSSPFLHYTHRQAPRETHLAEVDVDPVSGRKILNHYEIISELGRGVHGKVKLGRNLLDDTFVAIKIVERVSKRRRLGKTGDQENKIKAEIAILKKARHPNIVGLLEVIDDPAKKKVYIILEHAELGEVEWRTRGEPEICLVEFRRNKREGEGIFENEAEMQHDQHIMETAHRQLKRRERATNVGGWSLELGAESDNEPQSPVGGRYAPVSNPLRAGFITNPRAEQPDVTHHSAISEIQAKPSERHVATIDTLPYHPPPSNAMSTAEVQAGFHDVDGTMYGAYNADSPIPGSPSVFDSWASSHDESLESRIPEHFSYVPTMSLAETRRAIRDTVLGLEYLHYQGVVHRDIKPANLLQTKDHHVKISDFGVSYLGKTAGEQTDDPSDTEGNHDYDEALELAKTVGTPAFYAPELCRLDIDEEDPAPVTNQIDVWALGVTLYCLIFGRVPFHHDNTFALMRLIAERDVFIPNRRLKAVEYPRELAGEFASQKYHRQMVNCNKRAPHDLEYEDVTDDLKDLLLRLLNKDPRKRIKLADVKHHPWLLSGIQDPKTWLDESDPSHLTQGKKIEVSKEDVDVAVVPLNIGETIKDLASRGLKKLGASLGLGKGTSRKRAKSSAAGGLSSNASSSSTISQDAQQQETRRQSTRPGEILLSPIGSSRDGDHPLSRSVTASPEPKDYSPFFGPDSRSESPAPSEHYSIEGATRPDVLARGISGTGSIRTIRQSDLLNLNPSGAATAPALPSTPNTHEKPPSGLGSIFGGPRHRGRLDFRRSDGESSEKSQHKLNTFLPLGHEDRYSQPSTALSQEFAAGRVNSPSTLLDGILSSRSAAPSPISSRAPSISSNHEIVKPSDKYDQASRASSISSASSRGRLSFGGKHHPYQGHVVTHAVEAQSPSSPIRQMDADAIVAKAKEEQLRRLIREGRQNQELALQASSPISSTPCPPSPDDLDFSRYKPQLQMNNAAVIESPDSEIGFESLEHDMVPSESEEQFMSSMSQSTSTPSVPSAFSANSSIGTDEMALFSNQSAHKPDSWVHSERQDPKSAGSDLEEQRSVLNDEDTDYSSDEQVLEMVSRRRKSPTATRHSQIAGHSIIPLAGDTHDVSPQTRERRLSTTTMTRSHDSTDFPTSTIEDSSVN